MTTIIVLFVAIVAGHLVTYRSDRAIASQRMNDPNFQIQPTMMTLEELSQVRKALQAEVALDEKRQVETRLRLLRSKLDSEHRQFKNKYAKSFKVAKSSKSKRAAKAALAKMAVPIKAVSRMATALTELARRDLKVNPQMGEATDMQSSAVEKHSKTKRHASGRVPSGSRGPRKIINAQGVLGIRG